MPQELLIAFIAAGAALLGGLTGSILGRVMEHDQWKRDRKLEAYSDYLLRYRELQETLAEIRNGDPQKILEELPKMTEKFTRLNRNNSTLVATQQVAYWMSQLDANALSFTQCIDLLNLEEQKKNIYEWQRGESDIMAKLQMAMRKDLKLKWTRWRYEAKI